MDVSFTLGEIEERDFEVKAQPGRDNIWVCTCTGFCLRETGRNACLCSSAQQFCTSSCHRARGTASLWMNTRCVAGRFFRKWRGIKVYLFVHVETFLYSSKHGLYFINYLCFFIVAKTTFHHVRLTNNSGLSLRSTDWKSTLKFWFVRIKVVSREHIGLFLKQDTSFGSFSEPHQLLLWWSLTEWFSIILLKHVLFAAYVLVGIESIECSAFSLAC